MPDKRYIRNRGENQRKGKKQMTADQINIECAKLDGHYLEQDGEDAHLLSEFKNGQYNGTIHKDGQKEWAKQFKYTKSYDAIIPLIQKQDDDVFINVIIVQITRNESPKDLCVYLLKSKGLYK